MRDFIVSLNCNIPESFYTLKAAQSQDIDIKKKSLHTKRITADIESKYNIGIIVGSSGSGKTTLARSMFDDKFQEENVLNESLPVIDQFPDSFDYDKRQKYLSAIGLTSVPCWIRPAHTLSNGQKFRAEIALKCATMKDPIIIDEWTSVVDRTVAKVMSHSVQKFARRFDRKIILLSCHYDVIDWLLPDWIIDVNVDEYINRRELRQERTERINIEVFETSKETWKHFSKYHYLNENLPGGKLYHFGAFVDDTQIGYMCFANYVFGKTNYLHSNRIVVHPDYCGLGIGGIFVDHCCEIMKQRGFKIFEKNSSASRFNYLQKNPKWKLKDYGFKTPSFGSRGVTTHTKWKKVVKKTSATLRNDVRWYSWEYSP